MDFEFNSLNKMKEDGSSAVSCLNKLAFLAGSTWKKENFDCHLCKYFTDSRAEFELHLSTHVDDNSTYFQQEHDGLREDRIYQCDECDYVTGWRGNLNKHKLRHSGEKPFICCECDYRTANKSNLERHKQKHEKGLLNDDDDIDNSVINSNNSSNLEDSLNKPSEKDTVNSQNIIDVPQNIQKVDIPKVKMFQCPYCEYRTKWSSNLSKHKRIHTRDKPFICDECDFRTDNSNILKQHKLAHINPQPYFIDGHSNHFLNSIGYHPGYAANCEMELLAQADLQQFPDERSILMDSPLDIYKSFGGKIFYCNECDYRTLWKANLEKHKLIHSEKQSFLCDTCGFDAVNQSNLNRHKLSHMKEITFQCDLCEYNTLSNRSFKIHELAHMGKQPFPCHCCDYVAISDSSLKEHRLKHISETLNSECHNIKNEEESFYCEQCNFKTTVQKDYSEHILSHQDQKSFLNDENDCNIKLPNHFHSEESKPEDSYSDKNKLVQNSENLLTNNEYEKNQNDNAIIQYQYHVSQNSVASRDLVLYHHNENKYLNSSSNDHENNFLFSHWRPKKSFQCSECEYSTPWKSNLNKHKRKHIREKMFLGSNTYSTGEISESVSQYKKNEETIGQNEPSPLLNTGSVDETKINENDKARETLSLSIFKQLETPAKSFHCDDCDYRTPWKSNLNKHKRKHSREKILNFENNENDMLHNNLLKDFKSLYSYIPEQIKYFSSGKKDEQSLVPMNSTQNFLQRDFWKYQHVDSAFTSHYMPSSSFVQVCQCDECGYITRWKSNLYKHKRNVHGRDNFPNNAISEHNHFLQQPRLLDTYEEKKVSQIDESKIDQSLANHSLSIVPFMHSQLASLPQSEETCSQNENTLSVLNENVFKLNLARNASKDLVECDECGYRTQWKSNLYKHKRNVHGREKIFDSQSLLNSPTTDTVSDTENKNLPIKDNLTKNSTKPVKCEFCGYQTTWKSNLYKHRRNVHGKEKLLNGFFGHLSSENSYDIFLDGTSNLEASRSDAKLKSFDSQITSQNKMSSSLQYAFVKELSESTNKYVKYFLCDECEYKTPWKSNLTKHRQKHVRERLCEYNTKSVKNCNRLPETQEKEENLNYEDDLEIAGNRIIQVNSQKCTEMTLQKRDRLTNIIDKLCHSDKIVNNMKFQNPNEPQNFQCDLCDFRTEVVSDFKSHRMTHIRKQLHSCDYCNYSTNYLSNLMKHKLKHDDKKYYFCDKCSFKASSEDKLNRHRLLHFRGILYRRNLKIHSYARKYHASNIYNILKSNRKKIMCNFCPYQTTILLYQTLHQLVHTRKVFHCGKCTFSTKLKTLFKLHTHRHAKKPLYNCAHCNFTSWWATHYSHHLLTKHPDKGGVYACKSCSYSTTVVDRFQKHLQYHNGYLPFVNSSEFIKDNQHALPETLTGTFVMFCSPEITVP